VHPILADICRAKDTDIRLSVLRQWQRVIRDEIQPQLDRLEALEAAARPKSRARKESADGVSH